MRMIIALPLLLLLLPAAAEGAGCSLKAPADGGEAVCLCEDAAGNEWDMTGLELDQTGPDASSLMATGACSGTYCSGQYEYHLGICANVPDMITSNGGIGGCSASDTTLAYRVDTSGPCPPSSSCHCEKLAGAAGTAAIKVTAVNAMDVTEGVQLEYQSTSFSPVIVTTVNILCDSSASGPMGEAEVVNDPSCGTTTWCSATINWRTRGICPGGGGGGTGWTITILICVAAGLYVGGGVGYTRYSTGHFPGTDGDGGLLSSHPHWKEWGQVPGLVADGWRYTLFRYQQWRGGGGEWDPLDSKGSALDDRLESADAQLEQQALVSGKGKEKGKGRRKSESAVKKKRPRKKKPRPSLPVQRLGEGDAPEGKE